MIGLCFAHTGDRGARCESCGQDLIDHVLYYWNWGFDDAHLIDVCAKTLGLSREVVIERFVYYDELFSEELPNG